MKKKIFILYFLLCDAATAEGILPSWMRRSDGYEDPRRNGSVAPKTTENSKPANQNFYESKKYESDFLKICASDLFIILNETFYYI